MPFLDAQEMRNFSRNKTLIFNEIRSIESHILDAADNGNYSTIIDDTGMTNPENVSDTILFHEGYTITGVTSVLDPENSIVSVGEEFTIDGITIAFVGTSLLDVVDEINAMDISYLEAVVHQSGADYFLMLIINTGQRIEISGNALDSLGMTPGSYGDIDVDNNTITIKFETLSVGDRVIFTTDGQLPSPLVASTKVYYVLTSVDSNGDSIITLSEEEDGPEINITSEGIGDHYLRVIDNSVLFFQVWKNIIKDTEKKDQFNQVLNYFRRRKYLIQPVTNTETNVTFKWNISW